MIKKAIVRTLILTMLLMLVPTTVAVGMVNTTPIEITINGEQVIYTDSTPYIDAEGRIMVPFRAIIDTIGAGAYWEQESRRIYLAMDNRIIRLQAGSNEMMVNGSTVEMDAPLVFNEQEGRTYVPLRTFYENLEADVIFEEWEGTFYIDVEEHSWLAQFDDWDDDWDNWDDSDEWEDWENDEYYDMDIREDEPLASEQATVIVEEMLTTFQQTLAAKDFTLINALYYAGYQEFIDDFGANFFPESAFDIVFHDSAIVESYGNFIKADVTFDYVNYYRMNLRALDIYFNLMLDPAIDPENDSEEQVRSFIEDQGLLQTMDDIDTVSYKRTMTLYEEDGTWYIVDFNIQGDEMFNEDMAQAAEHIELDEVFELFFQEARFMALFFGALSDDLNGNNEDFLAELEKEIEQGKEEFATSVGYDSYADMIEQVQKGSDEFYRIIDEFSMVAN